MAGCLHRSEDLEDLAARQSLGRVDDPMKPPVLANDSF